MTVARLVLEEAKQRGYAAHVVEWPGGQPQLHGLEIQVSRERFAKVRGRAKSVPLGPTLSQEWASVPQFSLVTVRDENAPERSLRRLAGPAKYWCETLKRRPEWYLPLHAAVDGKSDDEIAQVVRGLRERHRLDPVG